MFYGGVSLCCPLIHPPVSPLTHSLSFHLLLFLCKPSLSKERLEHPCGLARGAVPALWLGSPTVAYFFGPVQSRRVWMCEEAADKVAHWCSGGGTQEIALKSMSGGRQNGGREEGGGELKVCVCVCVCWEKPCRKREREGGECSSYWWGKRREELEKRASTREAREGWVGRASSQWGSARAIFTVE